MDHAGIPVGAAPGQTGTTTGQQTSPTGPSPTGDPTTVDSPAGTGSASENRFTADEPDGLSEQMVCSGHSLDPLTVQNVVSRSSMCDCPQVPHGTGLPRISQPPVPRLVQAVQLRW